MGEAGDPRGSKQYADARARYLGALGDVATCCMCRQPIDMSLSGRDRAGPTVEHMLPIRDILARTQTYAQAVNLACDITWWDVAHRACQCKQGADVTNGKEVTSAPIRSREW